MERGLSSESNSVSSPPTPSNLSFLVCHLNSSTITDTDYLLVMQVLADEHTDDFVVVSFVDLMADNFYFQVIFDIGVVSVS